MITSLMILIPVSSYTLEVFSDIKINKAINETFLVTR